MKKLMKRVIAIAFVAAIVMTVFGGIGLVAADDSQYDANTYLKIQESASVVSSGRAPYKLSVVPAPSKVNADGSYSDDGYNYLVVQLRDINGNPALAPEGGITVTLTSSDTTIGKPYHSSITIPAGDSSAKTYFTPTYTSGSVIITASSVGLVSGSAVVTTVEKTIIPSVSIYTDTASYKAGDTMHLGLDVTNPGDAQPVRFAIWLEQPGGGIIVVTYTSITLPAGLDYNNPNFMVFTLPDLPSGTYIWHAALIEPSGPVEFISYDTAEWEFVLTGPSTEDIAEALERSTVVIDFGE